MLMNVCMSPGDTCPGETRKQTNTHTHKKKKNTHTSTHTCTHTHIYSHLFRAGSQGTIPQKPTYLWSRPCETQSLPASKSYQTQSAAELLWLCPLGFREGFFALPVQLDLQKPWISRGCLCVVLDFASPPKVILCPSIPDQIHHTHDLNLRFHEPQEINLQGKTLVILWSTPRCGSGPKCGLEAPPPPPPCALGPLPPPAWAAPSRSLAKRAKGGGRRKERAGREGVWLEGRVLQLEWGMGGDPPNTSWGQTHIWGLL